MTPPPPRASQFSPCLGGGGGSGLGHGSHRRRVPTAGVSFPHGHDWALPRLSGLTAPQTADDPRTPTEALVGGRCRHACVRLPRARPVQGGGGTSAVTVGWCLALPVSWGGGGGLSAVRLGEGGRLRMEVGWGGSAILTPTDPKTDFVTQNFRLGSGKNQL